MPAVHAVAEKALLSNMLTLAEISMFINEDVYILPKEVLNTVIKSEVDSLELSETEEESLSEFDEPTSSETIIEIPKIPNYNPVLFIIDKPLSGLSEETFNKLVFNALKLKEEDFTVLNQDDITFSKAEQVNSKKIILFGASFTGFQQKYKLHSEGEKLILLADSMDRIAGNKELKTELWLNLQMMFPS